MRSGFRGCVFHLKRWKVRLASLIHDERVVMWRSVTVLTSVPKSIALSWARWSPKSLISVS